MPSRDSMVTPQAVPGLSQMPVPHTHDEPATAAQCSADITPETDHRMQTYLQQEQEYLQYVRQFRQDHTAVTLSTHKHDNHTSDNGESVSRGLQCLLALTHLLEETVKLKMCELSSEKDHEDLCELRKQAERMGLTDRHNDTSSLGSNHHHTNVEGSYNDDLIEEHRLNGPLKSALDVPDCHDFNNKSRSLKVGTQILALSGTLGRVKTRFLKNAHRESDKSPLALSSQQQGSGYAQRKQKSADDPKFGIAALVMSSFNPCLTENSSIKHHLNVPMLQPDVPCQCQGRLYDEHDKFCQRQLLTPPTPLDLGDVWLGADQSTLCSPPYPVYSRVYQSDDSACYDTARNGDPSDDLFQRVVLNRHLSASVVTKNNRDTQDTDYERFASLPDNLDDFDFPDKSTKSATNKIIMESRHSVVSFKTSYDEAVHATTSHSVNSSSKFYVPDDSQSESAESSTQRVKDSSIDQLKDINLSKDFAKKLDSWAQKKSTGKDAKDNHSKPRSGSNQTRKNPKKRRGHGFNRQRSMSADRAGLLAGSNNAEFEEKLRQWGIKQAHDPHYYLNSKTKDQGSSVRSVESPARLSRRDESELSSPPSQPNSTNSSRKSSVKSPVYNAAHRPVAIERGRRVSPHRPKRYSRDSNTSHGSHRSSNEAMSSSSGSADPINQLSPNRDLLSVDPHTLRSMSAESLLSTGDEEIIDLDRNSSNARPDLMRPLSMIGMPGSLEGDQPISPLPSNNNERKLSHSNSRDLLKTINEDIHRIRERKAMLSDSSSERSLERSLAESTPERSMERYVAPVSRRSGSLAVETDLDSSSDLPSHSICVDSGMVMDEDEYCEPVINPPRLNDQIVIIEHPTKSTLPTELLPMLETTARLEPTPLHYAVPIEVGDSGHVIPEITQDQLPEQEKPTLQLPRGSSTDEARLRFSRSRSEAIADINSPERDSDPLLAAIQAHQQKTEVDASSQPNSPQTESYKQVLDSKLMLACNDHSMPSNSASTSTKHSGSSSIASVAITKDSSKPAASKKKKSKKAPKATPVKEEKISVAITSSKSQSSTDATTEALEPLLSSKTVPLKTKLAHLSDLYSSEDAINITVKQEEPSGPYDIFKAPKKNKHNRSRSQDVLDTTEYKSRAEDTLVTSSTTSHLRVKSFSEQRDESFECNNPVNISTSSALSQSSLQASPVVMRKNLKSPVPVLDLVSKFDCPASKSPLVSPTHHATAIPAFNAQNKNMARIAERLLLNQNSKPKRCTVDLTRHVREIPKEGAVQRARSIFMDMSGS